MSDFISDFSVIRGQSRLLMEYVRGSHLYGLNVEGSDVDTGGVFMCTRRELLGCCGYRPQVSDRKNDNTWYEVGELVRLLLKSNPTALESLFVPDGKIIGGVHPIMRLLRDNREAFLTKECFNPFLGYERSQIEKARGLNKKIVNPVNERLSAFDFAYTFERQGSKKIKDWLSERGLDKDYCGLVRIPNMHDTYGVYYDWGRWFEDNGIGSFRGIADVDPRVVSFVDAFYGLVEPFEESWWYYAHKGALNYRGMCLEASTELRCSSVAKGEKPLCHIVYNESGFSDHCRKYKEYKEWEKERNPVRYESNLNKNYDSKNISHCFRLMHMAIEIANGDGFNLVRTYDRDFLLDVRNHKYEYDEIISMLGDEKERMDDAMSKSTIPEKINVGFVNDIMIEIREMQLNELKS